MTDKIEIFVDLDDVVADWMKYARNVLKHPLPVGGVRIPDTEWNNLRSHQRMYRDLAVREGAVELMEWLTDFRSVTKCGLYFLSAIPRRNDFPYAPMDKVHWCDVNFPGIPVFLGPYSHEKIDRCTGNNSILLDDRLDNCTQWIAAGGRAHQYKKWEDCKSWLEKEL